MTNKKPASGAYETPAADSHINNLEWIIQKRSGSNPSNNILSRSLSAQWGLKQQTDTESNTLKGEKNYNNKINKTRIFHHSCDNCNIRLGVEKKKEGMQETNSTMATIAAINKGSSARSMNTLAALCMNLIFSKWEIILSLRSFNRKSLERTVTKVHHLYPPMAAGSV